MKEICPNCKFTLEFDENEYTPGTSVELECPMCGQELAVYINDKKEEETINTDENKTEKKAIKKSHSRKRQASSDKSIQPSRSKQALSTDNEQIQDEPTIVYVKSESGNSNKWIFSILLFIGIALIWYISKSGQQSSTEEVTNAAIYNTIVENVEFDGYINDKYKIVVTLSLDGAKVHGQYYYVQTMLKNGDKPSTYISLTGTVEGNGNAKLTGTTNDGVKETWQGKFGSNNYGKITFQGTFYGSNGKVFSIYFTQSN